MGRNIIFQPLSKTNRGFAAGNNLVVKQIKSKYVLFLNPDTILEKNTLKACFDYMEKNKKVGALTCRLELANGELDYASHRGFPTPLNSLFFFTGISCFHIDSMFASPF